MTQGNNPGGAMKKMILIVGLTASAMISGIAFSESDHQKSRHLVEQGDILPLQQILERLGQERAGRVLEVELENEDDRYIYEIELLGEAGRVWEYEIDASTGEILDREQEE